MLTTAIAAVALCAFLMLGVLTPSKRFINTSGCTFTPTGGSAISITGITSINVAQNPEEVRMSGDADLFDTFAGLVSLNPNVKISTNKPNLLDAVAPGAYGVLTWTRNDAVNGAVTAGGAKIYTVSGAYYFPQGTDAPHRQGATTDFEFHTLSTDGTTNPVAVAAA